MATANQNIEEVIDYANPTLKAEKALKDMHNAMLEHDYETALACAMTAIVETKLAYNAILHEKEKQV